MITIFNRKQLTVTHSLETQALYRAKLEEKGIDYYVNTVNRLSPSPISRGERVYTGTYGQDTSLMIEYIFYVKRKDYSEAIACINQK